MAEENSENLTYQKLLQENQELRRENSQLTEENTKLKKDSVSGWFRQEPAKQEFLKLVEKDPNILKTPITVMAVDLKGLSAVNNDLRSHDAGDNLIRGFVSFIESYLEKLQRDYPFYRDHLKTWIPGRLYEHGDEFGFIFVGLGQKQAEDIEIGLRRKPVSKVEVAPGVKWPLEFRVGFSSSDGDEEKRDLKTLREQFPEDIPYAAEMLNYLKKGADVKERERKKNG